MIVVHCILMIEWEKKKILKLNVLEHFLISKCRIKHFFTFFKEMFVIIRMFLNWTNTIYSMNDYWKSEAEKYNIFILFPLIIRNFSVYRLFWISVEMLSKLSKPAFDVELSKKRFIKIYCNFSLKLKWIFLINIP